MKHLMLVSAFLLTSAANAQETVSCFDSLANDARFAPISQKIALRNAGTPSVALLTNDSKPTPNEKEIIKTWMYELETCMQINPAYRMDGEPAQIANLFKAQNVDFFMLTADLTSGKLTFAEYAKSRAKTASEFNLKLQAAIAAEVAQRDASASGEAARLERKQEIARQERHRQMEIAQAEARHRAQQDQAFLNMMMNRPQMQTYQAQPYQMPVPKTTNCNMYGNQMNCTTR